MFLSEPAWALPFRLLMNLSPLRSKISLAASQSSRSQRRVESCSMTRTTLGLMLGLGIGAVDVLMMVPLSFPDKRAALLGAFCARFALGFFAATVRLPTAPVVTGVIVGILTSLPDAIITKAYAPIMASGVIFGAIAGWIVGRWGGSL